MKKYTDIDLFPELRKMVDKNTQHYKSDFDIDMDIIRKYAISAEPLDKPLLWISRPSGTHCLRESEVFIKGTHEHSAFCFYAEQTQDKVLACVIVPKRIEGDSVIGDLFEINYREHAALVANKSVEPEAMKFDFEDGTSYTGSFRKAYDVALSRIETSGQVVHTQTLPKDVEAHASILSDEKNKREKMRATKRDKPSVRDKLKIPVSDRTAIANSQQRTKVKEMEI